MPRSIFYLLLLYIGGNIYAQTLIDSIIAVVNTEAITRSELENEIRIATIVGKTAAEPSTPTEKRAVLETIINRKFVLQESERIGVVIAARDDRIAGKIAEIHTRFASNIDFQNALQQHQLETETLRMWTYEQLIYDEFFRRIFFNDIRSAVVERLAKSYYETNKTEFIVPPSVTFNSLLIVVPENISQTEKQDVADRVQKLSARLQQGETFEAVRNDYKTQLSIVFKVLTLETDTPLGTLVTELKDSERSEPLVVAEGYRIVERIRTEPEHQKEYADVREEITEKIQQAQAEKEFELWLNRQKEEGTWHILDDELTQAGNEAR